MTQKHPPLSKWTLVSLVPLLGVLFLVGCAAEEPAPPAAPAAPVKVSNAQLGIEIADLPKDLEVVSNTDATIELKPKDPAQEGRLVIDAGPKEKGGINLVEAVQQHKAAALAREGGVYKGQSELGAPIGTTFTSRAQWPEGGRTLEEVEVFMIHPSGDRKLFIHYQYPLGEDSPKRMSQHILALVGELGPATEAPATDSAPAPDAVKDTAPAATPGGG